ncbi:MAG: 50S ribosomal protein L10 [Thermoleophilaceae bacterium]
MKKDQKATVIEEVASQIQESEAIFAVDYRGISVPQAAELRARLTDAGARFRVVKNTLTVRAAEQAGANDLKELLEGPTAFTFVAGDGDVAVAAKALAQFGREHDVLDFKGGRMSGEPLTGEQIQAIARLPALDVLHGQLVGTVAAPITGLVRGLNALISGLAIQLQQIVEQGLAGGEAPAAEAEAEDEAPGSEESSEEAGPTPEEPSTEVDQDAQAEEAADEAKESSGEEEGAEPSTEADQEPSDDSPAEGDGDKEG